MNISESNTFKEVAFLRKEKLLSWKVKILLSNVFINCFIYLFFFFKKSFVIVEITNILTRELQWSYEIFAGRINRFLGGIEKADESYFFMFYRVSRTIGKIYGTLFALRVRCTTCAMFCQIGNTSGIVIRI